MTEIATPPPPSAPGHPSRRDNQSVSSTHSSGSRSSGRTKGNPAVESAVTRLLVSIKALLEALTLWSENKMSENEVSDVYVRLGNDFNAAVAAFASYQIEMTELLAVPDELRSVLEECLSEDANPTNLNKYLPTVRSTITGLLQGLRGKQTLYRQVASQSRHRSSASSSSSSTTLQDGDNVRSSVRSSHSRVSSSSRAPGPDSPTPSDTPARRSASGPRASRRRDQQEAPLPPPPAPPPSEQPRFVGGFAPPTLNPGDNRSPGGFPEPSPSTPGPNGFGPRAPSPSQSRSSTPQPAPADSNGPIINGYTPDLPAQVPPPVQRAHADVKRYSLVDRPVSLAPPAPAVIVQSPSDDAIDTRASSPPLPQTPPMDAAQSPAIAASLVALKKSDALERRASKRFSSYNITKITGGSLRGPSSSSSANRRSMAASNALTAGELAVLTEADEAEETESPQATPDVKRQRSRSKSPMPPMPRLPEHMSTPVKGSKSMLSTPQSTVAREAAPPASPPPADGPVNVFLQVGREVKKVLIEPGCSFASLRMLFLDRFSYNPGKENFPAIYIRDPASGVQYELEDMDEVKDKCLLSLNIEPLDQIKQHIDVQMASLAQDLKDLKASVVSNRRQSFQPAGDHSFVESTPMAPRPTDRQFANVARRISRFVRPEDINDSDPPPIPVFPNMTGNSLFPQMTGASVMSEYTARVVGDLKTQFDEVQNLRRDLGVMRQLYTEFSQTTKTSLGTLRTQTQNVRQLANTNVGGARGYIVSGKTKIDARSQDVLTKMEELQDLVENVKDDVLKRQITPKPVVMKSIRDDIAAVTAELKALEQNITTVRPMWKKTWEEELQNIVEEQQFLSHQEEFLADLQEDEKAVLEIFGHVEKVISIRKATPGRRKTGPRLPTPGEDSGGGRDNVLLEIRSAAVDPERRLKAIAANQKTREKELANKDGEFEQELAGFVGASRLKKTGGAEEAERMRQKRNDMTLKAMFTGDSTYTVDGSG